MISGIVEGEGQLEDKSRNTPAPHPLALPISFRICY